MTIDHHPDQTKAIAVLTVASVPIPATRDLSHLADSHLAGFGLIIATAQGARQCWRTESHIRTITAGQSEAVLLSEIASLLPAEGVMTGWRIAELLLPPLLNAAKAVEPDVAELFLRALAPLAASPVSDLAIPPADGANAPFIPRHDAAPGRPTLAGEITETAWATGRTQGLELMLRAQVEALWRMWLDRHQQSAPREPA